MNAKILIAGVAVAVMVSGVASAKMHRHVMTGGAYAAPAQPVPYAQLEAYMKASAKQRMAMMASGGAMGSTEAAPSAAMPAMSASQTGATAMPPAGAAPMTPGTMPPNAAMPPNGASPPMATPATGAGGVTPPQ